MNFIKVFISLLFSQLFLEANVYYSKVEPYEIQNISSNVMGVITYTKEDSLGKKLTKKPYLIIDAQLDREELQQLKKKLVYFKEMLQVDKEIVVNLEKSLVKKRLNYERVKDLKIKSTIEKDREFYDLINSENIVLGKKNEVSNLKVQIADLELRKAQLLRTLKDKRLVANGFTLYSLEVKVGQVVAKGTPLATLMDTSKAILTLYLDEEDVVHLKEAIIYIDGKKTSYKIDRILTISDAQNISKYKAQIIIKAPKLFSKLVKVELRNKNEK